MNFICSRICSKKKQTLFILAIPAKDDLNDLFVYNKQEGEEVAAWDVFKWVENTLMSRIQTIKTQSELEDRWFKFSSTTKTLNKLVLLTDVNNPPLFYPVLGVQLRKRLTFGMMVVDKRTSMEHSSLHLPEPPAYVMFMPDIVYRYGRNIGESEMRDTMKNFLLLLSPKEDDVLAFSSIIFIHSILLFIFIHWKPSVYLFLSFFAFWAFYAFTCDTGLAVTISNSLSYLWRISSHHPCGAILRFCIQWYMAFTGLSRILPMSVVIVTGLISGWSAKKIFIIHDLLYTLLDDDT